MMKTHNRILNVLMNGILIGKLEKTSKNSLTFAYDAEWLQTPGARPISLSLPLISKTFSGDVVYNFFDNLLPDNPQIRAKIQAKFQVLTNQPFDLLASIGKDCVGAIQIIEGEVPPVKNQISYEPLTEKKIATVLRGYQNYPLGMVDRESDFRISIAGAQEKTALLWYDNKWCLPHGVTPTSHIIKLPIGKLAHSGIDLSESVENEWLCLNILSAYHLPVNQAKMVKFEDVKTLVVERFDRRWSEDRSWLMRLPQEDLCQALGRSSGLKYESDGGPGMQDIMNVLLGSQEASEDRKKFMKAVFLFWVLGAIDGHAKNFSISIEPEGRYKLTPLYDVISAYPLVADKQMEWHRLKMAMSLKGKNRHYEWSMIRLRHWLTTSDRCQFSEAFMQAIMDEVFDQMEGVIDQVTSALPAHFPQHISASIFAGMRRVKNRCIK